MNIEQEQADFESWYRQHHGRRDMYERDASGEYADKQVQGAFNVWQARAALKSQTVIDDDHLSIVLDVYDNAMQKAFDGREFQNPCKPGTPEHKAWEKGSKEGKNKLDAGLPNSIALQSQDREDAEVTSYALPNGTTVERSMQRDGSFLWAIRDALKRCLSKSGEWAYELYPSSRTEEWLDQHRFSSAEEAINHARHVGGNGV